MSEKYDEARKIVASIVNILREEHEPFQLMNVIEDLEESIESYGIKVFYSEMEGFDEPSEISGYSQINKDGYPIIVININQSYRRQRFTMAHELGHIILDWRWDNQGPLSTKEEKYEILYRRKDVNNHRNNKFKEFLANEFAAELLIPKDFLMTTFPIINGTGDTDNDYLKIFGISMIADSLNVSEDFAKVQVKKYENELFQRGEE